MLQCKSVFGFIINDGHACRIIDDDPVRMRQVSHVGYGDDCAEAGVKRGYFIDLWFWHVSLSPSSVYFLAMMNISFLFPFGICTQTESPMCRDMSMPFFTQNAVPSISTSYLSLLMPVTTEAASRLCDRIKLFFWSIVSIVFINSL